MRRIRAICATCCLLVVALGPANAVALRYKGKAGEKYTEKSFSTGAMETTNPLAPGKPIRSQLSANEIMVTRVISASEDALELETETIGGEVTTTLFGEKMTQPAGKTKIYRKISPRGKVLDFRMSGKEGGAEQDKVTREMMAALAAVGEFPEKDLKPDDTWSLQVELPQPGEGGPQVMSVDSKLLGLVTFKGRPCAKIRSNFQLPLKFDFPGAAQGASGMTGEMTGKLTGAVTSYFDTERGRERYSEGTMNAALTITMRGGVLPQEMSVDTKMVFNLKTSLLEE